MKVGDKVLGNGEPGEIMAVEREPKGPVPGRYTVRFSSGMVIQNFPGYQLKNGDIRLHVPRAPSGIRTSKSEFGVPGVVSAQGRNNPGPIIAAPHKDRRPYGLRMSVLKA